MYLDLDGATQRLHLQSLIVLIAFFSRKSTYDAPPNIEFITIPQYQNKNAEHPARVTYSIRLTSRPILPRVHFVPVLATRTMPSAAQRRAGNILMAIHRSGNLRRRAPKPPPRRLRSCDVQIKLHSDHPCYGDAPSLREPVNAFTSVASECDLLRDNDTRTRRGLRRSFV